MSTQPNQTNNQLQKELQEIETLEQKMQNLIKESEQLEQNIDDYLSQKSS